MKTPLGLACLLSLPIAVLLGVLVAWNPPGNHWKTVEPPKAQVEAYDVQRLRTQATLTAEIYDHRKLSRLIREPQNTVSNLPYATAGLAILLAARRPAAINLGLAGIFLGFGSGMYHASLLPEWRMIDILGVYAVLYFLILIGAMAPAPRAGKGTHEWAASLIVWTAAIYTGIHRNDIRWFGLKLFDSTYVFVAAVAVGWALAFLAFRRATNRRACFRALATFALAGTISFAGGLGDRFGGFWADPEFLVQGHAVWHTCGAIALLAIYELFAAAGGDPSTFIAIRPK
ncbi:MAG TPA: ceramidase domain-containing protein [Lacunisphaera sp.]|nr:ceramidase domain-containing protein [Lacunisphaera sp.]